MSKTIDFTNSQSRFILSPFIHTGFIGGYGSGKSFVATFKTIKKLIEINVNKDDVPVAYYLPTYSLIQDVAFPYITNFLNELNITYKTNYSSKKINTPYGNIILRSMDNPDTIVGYEVGYSIIDEADTLPRRKMNEAFKNILARTRRVLPDGMPNQIDFVSTPEGYGFLYDFFVRKKSENKLLIKGRTYDNKHLPAGYIDNLKGSYTEQQLNAYLNGDFVNFDSGNVYYNFNRDTHHSDRTIQENDTLHIGMDFNITKMNAVVRVIDGNISTAVAEITNAYDTANMLRIIKEKFGNHRIFIYPDASGNARNSAGNSDFDLIRQAGFPIKVSSQNPRVMDRVNIVNASFLNAKNETVNFINTTACPELTEAYEQLGYNNGLPDKGSGLDHIIDADGYAIYMIHKRKPRVSFQLGGGNLL